MEIQSKMEEKLRCGLFVEVVTSLYIASFRTDNFYTFFKKSVLMSFLFLKVWILSVFFYWDNEENRKAENDSVIFLAPAGLHKINPNSTNMLFKLFNILIFTIFLLLQSSS